jgi:hypothetical protein
MSSTKINKQRIIGNYTIYLPPIQRTLQGYIYEGSMNNCTKSIIIKLTDKKLHNDRKAVYNGTKIFINENIFKEKQILQYITKNAQIYNIGNYIPLYIDFFEFEENYFLIMEHGGKSLFEFVDKGHQYIKTKLLEINEWKENICKCAFKQMCTVTDILHNTFNICHLDISLI